MRPMPRPAEYGQWDELPDVPEVPTSRMGDLAVLDVRERLIRLIDRRRSEDARIAELEQQWRERGGVGESPYEVSRQWVRRQTTEGALMLAGILDRLLRS
ncbi:hypothetical protein [Actinoalloteichus hymeniacidonis]|uniref:Uncharacterized protein n=1 Tax=Actinoalloteichus hymeniacidonis TaxID=340345 RepID=A0AAC9HS35_9PSEU|nr:hypothetical protein [Actinoalloteichus hymeniacidonis]AOS64632.1 hypothetical protein TL08_19205 [Actinoalloteichus hymeniacidonis]MBB5907294.1 hypothetical protein [Actinoalloteichus hymeniacidonis]